MGTNDLEAASHNQLSPDYDGDDDVFPGVARSAPVNKQPTFVKLFRLSSTLCLLTFPFPISCSPPSSSPVPWFLRIGPAELILSQLLQGL